MEPLTTVIMNPTTFSSDSLDEATTLPSTIQNITTTLVELAKESATTTESTYQTKELDDDYYYYDYSELERYEEEANREYQEQLAKINSILSGSSKLNRASFVPDVYVNQFRINETDLFVKNPQSWDPLENFLSLVVAKIYLLVPAFIIGVLLGLFLWSVYLMVNKLISNSVKSSQEPEPQIPVNKFLQIREATVVNSVRPTSVIVAGKQTFLKPPTNSPLNQVVQGSSSTSSGISSSSSTPVPFESASEGGRNPPSTTNSSVRSKADVPEVLKAVDCLAQTVESAVNASKASMPHQVLSSKTQQRFS